jgi:hypothetical protein
MPLDGVVKVMLLTRQLLEVDLHTHMEEHELCDPFLALDIKFAR